MENNQTNKKPNILMIMVDQMLFPRHQANELDPVIRDVLSFRSDLESDQLNHYKHRFPGFTALRENAVVLANHQITSVTGAVFNSEASQDCPELAYRNVSTGSQCHDIHCRDTNFSFLRHQALGNPCGIDHEIDSTEAAYHSNRKSHPCNLGKVDTHILSVLHALDESGQAENTIVIFCPHLKEPVDVDNSPFSEAVHVPAVVHFPKGWDVSSDLKGINLRKINKATSHTNLLPTILELAGIDAEKLYQQARAEKSGSDTLQVAGVELSNLLKKGSIGKITRCDGVLFLCHKTISEPLNVAEVISQMGAVPVTPFEMYMGAVERLKLAANEPDFSENQSQHFEEKQQQTELSEGNSAIQPCYAHCVVDADNWKLVRYFDLDNENIENRYALYDLNKDPNEEENLAIYSQIVPGTDQETCSADYLKEIQDKARDLELLMSELENKIL
ncbi:sulfatase-like hydrolase/transferase [Endozoicomonadaceae bacterium StTr2]